MKGNHFSFERSPFKTADQSLGCIDKNAELILYPRNQYSEEEGPLSAHLNVKSFVYAFDKANAYIAENYNVEFAVGQWSTIGRLYKQSNADELLDYFVYHVNSFKPWDEMDSN